MAKALPMLLLLVAGTAVTSAHPIILGKGIGKVHILKGLLDQVIVSDSGEQQAAAQQQQQQQQVVQQAQQQETVASQVATMNNTAWNDTNWNNTQWNNTQWNNTQWNNTAWNNTAWNATNATTGVESQTTQQTTQQQQTTVASETQTQTLSEFLTEKLLAAHPFLGVQKEAVQEEQTYLDIKVPLPFHHKKQVQVVQADQETDLSKCECKDDCKEETRKKCKAKDKTEEKCEDVPQEEDVDVCEFKCWKTDNLVQVGGLHTHPLLGGRRLAAAEPAGLPHFLAKAALGALNPDGVTVEKKVEKKVPDVKQQQEICREVCKPAKRALPPKKDCKKVTTQEIDDCVVEVVSKRCVKNCKCGEKTITVTLTPDMHAIGKAVLHHG